MSDVHVHVKLHKGNLLLAGMEVKEHIKIRKPVNFVAVYLTIRACNGCQNKKDEWEN